MMMRAESKSIHGEATVAQAVASVNGKLAQIECSI
jgi:hypothetical protein